MCSGYSIMLLSLPLRRHAKQGRIQGNMDVGMAK